MNLNIFKPSDVIQDNIDRPNMGMALFLVLVPSLMWILFNFYYGFMIDFLALGYAVLKGYVLLVITTLLFYLTGYLFRGRELKGKLGGVMTAVSVLWVFIALLSILGFALIMLVPADTVTSLKVLDQYGASYEQVMGSTTLTNLEISDAMVTGFIMIFLVGFAVILWYFYYAYKLIKVLTKKPILLSFVMTLILLFLVGLVPLP
ncbi:MAG: hypothetical protein V1672_04270 [Candidatus Diapherotrites archaeon]